MNFKFFLSTFLWNVLFHITATQEQTNYFHPGEYKFTSELRYYVPFQQHLLDSNEIQFDIELTQEVKIEKQPYSFLSDKAKLLYFVNLTTEEDNMIMVLDNSNLYCLYLIKNYFLNQQLVITPHFCNITLPYQLCSKLVQVNKEIFISNCYLNNNQAIISIIDFDGKVFDQLIFEIEQNCKIEFSYGDFTLFIYQQNCESKNIYNVEIDEQLYQYKSFQKFNVTIENNITNSSFGQVKQINICNKERIILIYKNFIVYYNFKSTNFPYKFFGDNNTILNIFQSCEGQQSVLSIDNNSLQLKFDIYDLNVTNSQYIDALLIERILVLHFKDQIIVKINDQLQQKINISISEIVPIVDSSYFFGLYKSELKLFQLQPPKYFHSFNTSQRIIFLIFERWNCLQSFSLMQCNIEILNESEPRIIIDKEDMIILQNNNDEICVEQSKITKSLPINLQAIQDNDRYQSINKLQNIETYNLQFGEYSKVLHFWKLNDLTNIILVSVQSKDLIIFVFCKQDKIIKKQNIKILKNYIDIGVLQNSNILIFYEDHIQYFKIIDSQQIQKTQIIQNQKIIKINKHYNQIVILYENCKKSIVNYISDNFLFMEQPQNQPYDCTQTQQISITNLYIFQNYIIHNSTRFKKYIYVGKVIDVLEDVDQRLYVLILDEGNEIVLKLFRVLKAADFIFFYKIPTYTFIFEPSVNQKIENGFLMINAKNQNKTYLLVYNLRNQAINSLIYITEIDQSQQFYSYFDFADKTIVFLRDGKFYFQNLYQICFKYSFYLENSMIQQKQLGLIFNSFINNFNFTTKIYVYQLNSNYSLSLLNQTKIRNIYYQDNLDLDQIRGNIIKFEIQPIQDFIIKLPINITQEYISCSYYQSSICLKNETIIEIQSLNISDQLPIVLYNNSIKGIVFNQESLTYSIFYVDSDHILLQLILQLGINESKQFTISKKDILQKDLFQEEVHLINKVKIIKEIKVFFNLQLYGLLFYNNYCQIIDISEINSTEYFLIDGVYLSNNTYVFLYWNHQIIQMKILAFNNIQLISEFKCKGDIIQDHQINLIEIFERLYFQKFDDVLIQIEIIHLEMKGDLFIMKFVMIYKIYFILILEVSFNKIKYDNFVVQSYRFLRYEQNTHFLDLLYADNNFVVITLSSDSNQFINVYDIKGDMKYKDYLDSIQRIESFQYKKIEKYNASHYVIYSHKNDKVQFMTINQLQIECQGQCNEPSNLILSNDVSSISLKIQFQNISYLNVILTIKLGLIMTNLIFILIYIKLGKRAKRNQNKQFNGNL